MANSAVSLNIPDPATQSDMEAATDVTKVVTPGRAQFHPSACKCWVNFTGVTTTAINASYNVASLTDNGTGDTTITIATDFSSANYGLASIGNLIDTANRGFSLVSIYSVSTLLAGSVRVFTSNSATAGASDFYVVGVIMFGDQ